MITTDNDRGINLAELDGFLTYNLKRNREHDLSFINSSRTVSNFDPLTDQDIGANMITTKDQPAEKNVNVLLMNSIVRTKKPSLHNDNTSLKAKSSLQKQVKKERSDLK